MGQVLRQISHLNTNPLYDLEECPGKHRSSCFIPIIRAAYWSTTYTQYRLQAVERQRPPNHGFQGSMVERIRLLSDPSDCTAVVWNRRHPSQHTVAFHVPTARRHRAVGITRYNCRKTCFHWYGNRSNWNGDVSAVPRSDCITELYTRSSAIAGRPSDAKACQGLLKWTWK